MVRKDKRGKFAVIAWRRRLMALNLLAARGTISGEYEMLCQLASDESDAFEISLTWNVVRVAMHPACQSAPKTDPISESTPGLP